MSQNIIDHLLEETRQTQKETLKLSQIDEAAIALFSEKGYANTSTKEIANRAQVAEGTIFRHYKTKEKLLLNILLKFMKYLVPVMKQDVKNKLEHQSFETIEDFFRYFLKDRILFIQSNHDIFRIFVKELIYNDVLRNQLLVGQFHDISSIFYHYFDLFKEKGQLTNIDNANLFNRMLKIFLADAVWTFVLTDQYQVIDTDEWIERLIQQYLEGARHIEGVRQGGH